MNDTEACIKIGLRKPTFIQTSHKEPRANDRAKLTERL
jgi:hypothetical protein